MMRLLRSLWKNADGAVAPLVALSLVGLIAVGGIAFDYAHLATMHTELQDAADQAALAAATQLDGSTNARTRATDAAQSLLSNLSLFASDAGADTNNARKVTIATVNFYQTYDNSNDTYGAAASTDANARVVEVVVGGRRADYALTPIVAAFTSGQISARAAASLGSAVCNIPPMMMCQPSGGGDFPSATDIGNGVRLQPGPSTGAWAPGDYGYLDFGNGASGLKINLGKNSDASGCVDNAAGIPTEPGNKASVTDALNSRFDLYPAASSACNSSTGDYCPSQNVRKDLVMTEETVIKLKDTDPAPANPGCGAAAAKIVSKSNSTDTNGFIQSIAARGMTRDTCHVDGSCTSNFGNGTWDRAGYFAALHPGQLTAAAAATGTTTATIKRYDVHKWELANANSLMQPQQTDITDYNPADQNYYKQVKGANATYTFDNQCAYPQPKNAPPGVVVSNSQKDRRVLTVAVVDCTGLNGKSNVNVKNFVDVYLVEPSLDRSAPYNTSKAEIYGEIIGVAKRPNGQSAFQFYLRQRPRLIR